jgi:hypothetical protein
MEVNPLRRVLTAKVTTFVGLSMLVVVVMLVIASMDSVGQAGAKPKPKPQPTNIGPFGAKEVIDATGPLPLEGTYNKRKGGKGRYNRTHEMCHVADTVNSATS